MLCTCEFSCVYFLKPYTLLTSKLYIRFAKSHHIPSTCCAHSDAMLCTCEFSCVYFLKPQAKTETRTRTAFSATDVNKLACVSKTMQEMTAAPHIDTLFWKVNGLFVFGVDFEAVCSMCLQAGYSPARLPNFYRNINIFMSTKYVQELNFSTAAQADRNFNNTVFVTHNHAKHSLKVGRSRENEFCGLLDAGLSRSQGAVMIENGTIAYRHDSTGVSSHVKAHDATCLNSDFQRIREVVRLHMGDVVLIGNAGLTTLRVSLGKYDLLRLLDMMQASSAKHGSQEGPGSTDEAFCTLQLAQMQVEERTAAEFRDMIFSATRYKEATKEIHAHEDDTKKVIAFQTMTRMNEIQVLQRRLVEIQCLQRSRRMEAAGRATLTPMHEANMVRTVPHGLMVQSDASLAQQHDDIAHRLASMQLLLDEQQEKHTMALAQQAASFVSKMRLLEEKRQDANMCVICMDAPKTFAMMPCGHVCCCETCALQMIGDSCPLCRTNVTQVLKTWY